MTRKQRNLAFFFFSDLLRKCLAPPRRLCRVQRNEIPRNRNLATITRGCARMTRCCIHTMRLSILVKFISPALVQQNFLLWLLLLQALSWPVKRRLSVFVLLHGSLSRGFILNITVIYRKENKKCTLLSTRSCKAVVARTREAMYMTSVSSLTLVRKLPIAKESP